MRPSKPTQLQDLRRRCPPPDLKLLRPNKAGRFTVDGESLLCGADNCFLSALTTNSPCRDRRHLEASPRSDQPLLDSALRWFSVWKIRGKKYRFQLQTSELARFVFVRSVLYLVGFSACFSLSAPLPLCDVTTPLPPSLPGCLDHLQQLRQHDCNNAAAQQSATEDNKWWRWWPTATWWCDWSWTLNAFLTFCPTDLLLKHVFPINRNMYQHYFYAKGRKCSVIVVYPALSTSQLHH